VGNIYMGWSAPGGRAAEFEANDAKLGAPVGIVRLFSPDGRVDWTKVDYHRARGRISALSVKNAGGYGASNADLAAMNATARAWVDSLAEPMLARPKLPILFTVHHEPDNDITTSGAAETFRDAKRQFYHRMRVTNGVDNFVFVDAVWMGGMTFKPNTPRDWRWWDSNWKGTSTGGATWDDPNPVDFYTGPYVDLTHGSVTDVLGIDAYLWWGEAGREGTPWTSYRTIFGNFVNVIRQVYPTTPIALHEWACGAYCGDETHTNEVWSTANKNQTQNWMRDAYAYMLESNVVSACWFTSFDTVHNLNTFDPNRWRYETLRELCTRSTTVLPTVI